MNILIISPYVPWPLTTGGNAAVFATLKCLADMHQFTFICPTYTSEDEVAINELKKRLPQVKFKAVLCRSGLEQKARKTLQFINRSLSLSKNQPALFYPFEPLHPAFVAAISGEILNSPDLIQLEFAYMLTLAPWLPKNIPKLFVHHQVQFIYNQRAQEHQPSNPNDKYLAALMLQQEISLLQNFDGVITFSPEDKAALEQRITPSVFLSPFPVPVDLGHSKGDGTFKNKFVFLASSNHYPNLDAMAFLHSQIWPVIKQKLPEVKLYVVGNWSRKARQPYKDPNIIFTGFQPDLSETMKDGILLVPLRIGSGIRVKILAGLACGTPIVSTTIGSEGLPLSHGSDILVADNAIQFAHAAIRLAQDVALRQTLSTNGQKVIKQHYSAEAVSLQRNLIYQTLTNPLPDK